MKAGITSGLVCGRARLQAAMLAVAIASLVAMAGREASAACAVGDPGYVPLEASPSHPLSWKVWSKAIDGLRRDGSPCRNATVVDLADVVGEAVNGGGIVILGEVHDNPQHHHVRAYILSRAGRRAPALVFEHIRKDQEPALASALAAVARGDDRAVAPIFAALDWDKSGWPDKAMFAPIFQQAIDLKLPILAGHPSRESLRAVGRGGVAALADDVRKALHLDEPLPPDLQDALLDELAASHCGLVPKSAFGTMAEAQRYRDAHMAAALAAAAREHGSAILLTGNGHARTDRGVPRDLQRLAPGKNVLAVMLIEVQPERNDAAAYVPRAPDGTPAVDMILFTPPVEREDPCVAMREQFGKRR